MSAVVKIPTKENELVSYNPATSKEVGRVEISSEEKRSDGGRKISQGF